MQLKSYVPLLLLLFPWSPAYGGKNNPQEGQDNFPKVVAKHNEASEKKSFSIRTTSFFPKDMDGNIQNPCVWSNIPKEWRNTFPEIIEAYKKKFSPRLISVYVRGSVADGTAILGLSDLDTFCVVSGNEPGIQYIDLLEIQKNLDEKFPFVRGFDSFYVSADFLRKNSWMINTTKNASICIYGEDVGEALPKIKAGAPTIMHLQNFDNSILAARRRINAYKENKDPQTLLGISRSMKLLIRMGFELVCEQEKEYTRDLGLCFQSFAKYFPTQAPLMYKALQLAFDSEADDIEVKDTFDALASWMRRKLLKDFELIFNIKRNIDKMTQLSLCQLIERQAETFPNKIAVSSTERSLSYSELNNKANKLAHYFVGLGMRPNTLAAIYLHPSIDLITVLFAVLKTGAAYLPLDPFYPNDKLDFMLKDSGAQFLIREGTLDNDFKWYQGGVIDYGKFTDALDSLSEDNLNSPYEGGSPIYVFYTSGSTGAPKGIEIAHHSVLNYLLWMAGNYNFTEEDSTLLKTSFSFDASVWEMLIPLITGGAVIVASQQERKNTEDLISLIQKFNVTTFQSTPRILKRFILNNNFMKSNSLRRVFVGGERLTSDIAKLFFSSLNCELHNLYGPTETTIYSTSAQIVDPSYITIGKPISNTQIHILDEKLEKCSIGVPGEIFIGGTGLAIQYLNRPELTKERFIKNPFSSEENEKLYRTGDLGYYLDDGNITFLGRVEDQIKFKEYIIDIGEIEAHLNSHEAIQTSAVVIQRTSSSLEKKLLAYLVKRKGYIQEFGDLQTYLKDKLPPYMIPRDFYFIESMPLTPNGKVDKFALSTA